MGSSRKTTAPRSPRRSLPGSATAPDWATTAAWLAKRGSAADFARRARAWSKDGPSEEVGALLAAPSIDAIAAASIEVLSLAERVVMELARIAQDASLLPFVSSSRGLADAVRVHVGACGIEGSREMYRPPPAHLRSAVVLASEASYRAGRAVAEAARAALSLRGRSQLAYAFPDEPWAALDLDAWLSDPAHAASHLPIGFLLTATNDVEIVKRFLGTPQGVFALPEAAMDLAAVLPAEELLPLFEVSIAQLLRKPKYGAVLKTQPRRVAEAVATVGTTDAARVLARFASHPILAAQILAWFREHPEHTSVLESVAGTGTKLASTARRIAEKQSEKAATSHVAMDTALPTILRERPWTKKPEAGVVVIEGLARAGMELERLDEALLETFEEDPGVDLSRVRPMTTTELEAWRSSVAKKSYARVDFEYVPSRSGPGEYAEVPAEEGLAAWNRESVDAKGRPYHLSMSGSSLAYLRRHGVAAFPGWIRRDWPSLLAWEGGPEAMRTASVVVSPAIAPAMALVLTDRKQYRHQARAWLLRHPRVAALGLVPDAVGPLGHARKSAEAALVLIATSGERDTVERVASSYGAHVRAGIDALFARDPRRLERAIPKRPPILKREDLPPIRLRDRDEILGPDAIESVLDMLSLSLPEEPYAGLRELADSLEADSLGAFALELLEQWVLGDAPGRSEWMGFSVIHLPSPEGHARLVSFAREQSTKNQAKCERACVGLAAIGTDVALNQLSRIAATTRFQKLGARAAELLAETASSRGLSVDELEDRTVPELEGVDAKERARVLSQIARRLERMLVTGRTLALATFESFFVSHPVVGPLARTLLWESEDGAIRFRIAEDGSYADASDGVVRLPASARVRLAHPARTPALPAVWAQRLLDYEIVQAIEQLGRCVHTLREDDAAHTTLSVARGALASAKKLMGLLESRGWRRNSAGAPTAFLRDLGEVRATLPIAPGFEIQDLTHAGPQTLGAITFTRARRTLRLGELDPTMLSEVARDAEAASALGI
jgi:hypothetical protein